MRILYGAALASKLVVSKIIVDGVPVELARDELFIGAWNRDEGLIENGDWHSLAIASGGISKGIHWRH